MNIEIPYVLAAPSDGVWVQTADLTRPIPWLIIVAAMVLGAAPAALWFFLHRKKQAPAVAAGAALFAALFAYSCVQPNGDLVAEHPPTGAPTATFTDYTNVHALTEEELQSFVDAHYPLPAGFFLGIGHRGHIDDIDAAQAAKTLRVAIISTYKLTMVTTTPFTEGDQFIATLRGQTQECTTETIGASGQDIFRRVIRQHVVVLCNGIEPPRRATSAEQAL